MIYEVTIDTPITYSILSKLATPIKLEFGLIQELLVDFPPGSAGFLFLHINHGLSQIFPKSQGYFHGDNRLFEFRNAEYPIFTEPYELTAFTWNNDDLYRHEVNIYINLTRMGRFV